MWRRCTRGYSGCRIYAAWLRMQPPGVVVDLPIARANTLPLFEAEWSFYGRTHGHPMVNGYSGYFPRPTSNSARRDVGVPPRRQPDRTARQQDVRYIVVHEDRYDPADFLEFDARLRRTPGLTLVGRIPGPGLSGRRSSSWTLGQCRGRHGVGACTCRRRAFEIRNFKLL